MELIQVNLNFSSGRSEEIIKKLLNSLSDGGAVLDIDQGWDTDRTVITVAGIPSKIIKAVINSAKTAREIIDMNNYSGNHPHIGALDVCPVIPLKNSSLENCIAYSNEIADGISQLGIPVFLYGSSAKNSFHYDLANIRKGNFLELAGRISKKEITPDFGQLPHPTAGAACVGAENLYLAYNINLNTEDLSLAKKITSKFYKLRSQNSNLKSVLAIAWHQEKFKCCQISINLLDFNTFGLHDAFDFFTNLAQEFGIRTNGSEIIGLVPKIALQRAGRHYNASSLNPEDDAICYLGLNSVKLFKVEDKVLECKLEVHDELHNLPSDKW